MSISNVPTTPPISTPGRLLTIESIAQYLTNFVNSVANAFTSFGVALNQLIGQSNAPTAQINLPSFAKAALPPVTAPLGIIIVTDDTSGLTVAFSDGTNWRRVQDRNVIS